MVPVSRAGRSFAAGTVKPAVSWPVPAVAAGHFSADRRGAVLLGTMPVARKRARAPAPEQEQHQATDAALRGRILEAAFSAFMKNGFAQASMLEIATQAKVSKRELYALVGNKEAMLVACIQERAKRLQAPTELPSPRDREMLRKLLATFGAQVIREVTQPTVIATFRLAIAEAVHAPEVARALDAIGRETVRAALCKMMSEATGCGLLQGRPSELTDQFGGLLWGDLMVALLLGIAQQPSPREIARRAREAASAFLQLHPPAGTAPTGGSS